MTQAEEVPEGFSARRDAKSRTYLYRVLARRQPSPFERGRALWWPHTVDEDALHACAHALRGTHDFTAFTPTETYHTRFTRDVLRADWVRNGDILEFHIEADSFMRNMNRVLVGTMLEVAGGRRRRLREAPRRRPPLRRREHGPGARPVSGRGPLRVGDAHQDRDAEVRPGLARGEEVAGKHEHEHQGNRAGE